MSIALGAMLSHGSYIVSPWHTQRQHHVRNSLCHADWCGAFEWENKTCVCERGNLQVSGMVGAVVSRGCIYSLRHAQL